ncbi:MAG TPA: hypothetical protein PK453_02950 [Leptospiraceae bacterium]|nr:hypothetical protein [Leptospiraceae bacterium]HNF24079.1 hypothetical protein [Leptospiraceae bacterium]HNM02419.1 hypothetical protein [Leptospiraceae bacterium]HNN02385.1 hypothetical protein [Leptospiraceae bacterium]
MMHRIEIEAERKILILDGAMAAMIQHRFSLRELMELISHIEDGKTLIAAKSKFEAEKNLHHSEQAMLLTECAFFRQGSVSEIRKPIPSVIMTLQG